MIFFIILILQVMGWYKTTVMVDLLVFLFVLETILETMVARVMLGYKFDRKYP